METFGQLFTQPLQEIPKPVPRPLAAPSRKSMEETTTKELVRRNVQLEKDLATERPISPPHTLRANFAPVKYEGQTYQDTLVEEPFHFDLTKEEMATAGQDVAELADTLSTRQEDFERVKKRYKAEFEELERQIQAKFHAIRFGEMRNTRCTKRVWFERKVVQFIYEAKVLKEREMLDEERQLNLNGLSFSEPNGGFEDHPPRQNPGPVPGDERSDALLGAEEPEDVSPGASEPTDERDTLQPGDDRADDLEGEPYPDEEWEDVPDEKTDFEEKIEDIPEAEEGSESGHPVGPLT